MTRCITLPGLFAGKMHALIFRAWGHRVKGRDWYDFEWYVRNGVKLDFQHLSQRAKDFNNIDLTPDLFRDMLTERLASTDIEMVKKDVRPFIKNPQELEIWSTDYFMTLAGMIQFQ